jgi:hypothetical protein
VSLLVAATSALGLVALAAPGEARAAGDDSAVTVAWAGGNAEDLQRYQPVRDVTSVHHADFADVAVTVSRTRDLTDEAVSVTVTGMPSATKPLYGPLGVVELGSSFVQAMQCWGDPADELFYQNCQFGALGLRGAGSAAPQVSLDGNLRGGRVDVDVPFRAVDGTGYSSVVEGNSGELTEMLDVVRPQTTNERTAFVDATRTARFEFEVQSAASQPYLGCGDQASATGTRCWLVVVPRGLHTSAASDGCYIYKGQSAGLQQNSPVNPACEYWQNRVVVPLDFRPTGAACPPGAAERRVVGSELAVAAFSSWQTELCGSLGTVYSLSTSADALAREQLLNGQAQMVVTPSAVTADSVSSAVDPAQIAESDLVYAPVAVTSVGIAVLGNRDGEVVTDLRLTPRLLAKLLTQSYALESGLRYYHVDPVPGPWSSDGPNQRLTDDPEFVALNPDLPELQGASVVVTGPNGSDAIAQLWSYLQADDKARAFLSGEPDDVLPGDEGNTGMTINPYFLPRGHADARVPEFEEGTAGPPGQERSTLLPVTDGGEVRWRPVGLTGADGGPLCLCDADIDTFPKADQTLLPQQMTDAGQTQRYDMQQMRPYAATTEAAARMVFRGDVGSKTQWDASGSIPGYVSNGLSLATNVFLTGYTDAAHLARYRLPSASLQAPDQPGSFVGLDAAGMAAAVAAQTPTAVPGVTVTDPGALPAAAYPLTTVLYAAVNVGAADEEAREQYADLIAYAATDGQVPGHSPGQLPEGYLPLTDELRDQALAAVTAIRSYVPADPSSDAPAPAAPGTSVTVTTPSGSTPVAAPSAAADPGAATETGYDESATTASATTPGVEPAARVVLGGTLVAGLAGALASPFLLRRRGVPT